VTKGGSSPKILEVGGVGGIAPSSPSPLYPLSETEKEALHIGLHLKCIKFATF